MNLSYILSALFYTHELNTGRAPKVCTVSKDIYNALREEVIKELCLGEDKWNDSEMVCFGVRFRIHEDNSFMGVTSILIE